MILTHININPKLLMKLVASKLRMWAEAGWVESIDQWHGMISQKLCKYCTVSGMVPNVPTDCVLKMG